MFWSKKKKPPKKPGKQKKASKPETKGDERLSSEELRAEAMANVRAAREHIGEDTLDRIAAAMTKKQQSATEQAKAQIQSADPDRVLDEILYMLDERK